MLVFNYTLNICTAVRIRVVPTNAFNATECPFSWHVRHSIFTLVYMLWMVIALLVLFLAVVHSQGTAIPILKVTSSRRKLLLLYLRWWIETFISERKSRERQGSLDSRNWSLTRSFHGRVSGISSNGDVGRLMVTQRWHGIGKEGRLAKGSESFTVTFIRKVRGVASNYAHNDPRRRASTEDFSSEWRQITSDVSLLNDQYWILIVYRLFPFRKRTIK